MRKEEIEAEEAKPINLTINKSQAMLLSMAMTVLPEKMTIADVVKFSGGEGDGAGIGMLFAMGLMMLDKVVDDDEREKLTEALKEGHDYVNAQVDSTAAANTEFVSKAAFIELLNLTMETHGDMYKYYMDSEEQVALEDVTTFDILVNAHKIVE